MGLLETPSQKSNCFLEDVGPTAPETQFPHNNLFLCDQLL